MKYRTLHAWNISSEEALEIQQRLAPQVVKQKPPKRIRLIAGADVAYERNIATAAITVLNADTLTTECHAVHTHTVNFPYIPGLLAFREAPPLLEAWRLLRVKPDIIMLDGHGIAHPRRFGLASHVGLLLECSTIGCAKQKMSGNFEALGAEKRSFAPLMDGADQVGAAVRTRTGANPVFVSIGHLLDLDSAVSIILRCCQGMRIPEPLRQANILSRRCRKDKHYVASFS